MKCIGFKVVYSFQLRQLRESELREMSKRWRDQGYTLCIFVCERKWYGSCGKRSCANSYRPLFTQSNGAILSRLALIWASVRDEPKFWGTLAGFWGFLVGNNALRPLFIWLKIVFLSRKKSLTPFFLRKIIPASLFSSKKYYRPRFLNNPYQKLTETQINHFL